MKQPVKLASLRPLTIFDTNTKGLIRYLSPQEAAYLEAMGREPVNFPAGTIEYEQFTWRPGSKRSAADLAAPRAKAQKKTVARRARKPLFA